jgi:hypothetical protein
MLTADARLRAGIARHGRDLLLTLDPAFQGLPDTAHGGTVLAAFEAVAGVTPPAIVRGRYRRRVPLEAPLRLALARTGPGVACRLEETSGPVLVEGTVEPVAGMPGGGPDDGGVRSAAGRRDGGSSPADRDPGGTAHPLPVSSLCFVCGMDNALGLRARLEHDARAVRGTWRPSVPGGGGRLPPVALTSLLDEVAFWLGALASGESGMTTDLRVTLLGDVAPDAVLHVEGSRDRVRPDADDPRYWTTEATVRAADGRPLALARITFVAVRGAARRLVHGLLRVNPPDVVARVFPAYR